MTRLYLFAEGQTEQTFADNLLVPHLAQYGVYMHPPLLISKGRKKGKVHRGGGDRYAPVKSDILRFLKQEKSRDVFFSTMIDLYAIPSDFPQLAEAEKLRFNPQERVEFLERCFAEDIGDPRFIPYLQLHEYEAYIFANPGCFNQIYNNRIKDINILQDIADQYETPELINDGSTTAPSKRILAQFPDYSKVTDGTLLAELIGLQTIRSQCPHFDAWLLRLESLGDE